MPGQQDYNLFRRYIGDYDIQAVPDSTIDSYLNDATAEATAPHIGPDAPIITSYDLLPPKYSIEVILLAAINWWWNKIGGYATLLTTTIGQASEEASDRYQHALSVATSLQQLYDNTKVLGQTPDVADLSHWNRNTLTRVGGQSEEDAAKAILPAWTNNLG